MESTTSSSSTNQSFITTQQFHPNPIPQVKEPVSATLKKRRTDAILITEDEPTKRWNQYAFLAQLVTQQKKALFTLFSQRNGIEVQLHKLSNNHVPKSLQPGTKIQLGQHLSTTARQEALQLERNLKDSYSAQMLDLVAKAKKTELELINNNINNAAETLRTKLTEYCKATAWATQILHQHIDIILYEFREYSSQSELIFAHKLNDAKNKFNDKLKKEVEMQEILDTTPTRDVIQKLVQAEVQKQLALKEPRRATQARNPTKPTKPTSQPPPPKNAQPALRGRGQPAQMQGERQQTNASRRTPRLPPKKPAQHPTPPPQQSQQRPTHRSPQQPSHRQRQPAPPPARGRGGGRGGRNQKK